MVGVGTASDMPSNLVSLCLAGSGMLVRNKKVTATAQREERTLRNPKLTSARVSVKRQVHMHGAGDDCSDHMERPLAVGT